MSTVRRVVVDDTDSRIKYSDGWFQDHGSTDNSGNYGQTFQHTQHGTKANSSFSFQFEGTEIYAYGTTDVIKINNGAQNDPSWSCSVDGSSISVDVPFLFLENNIMMCHQNNLQDGPHTLNLQVSTQGRTFWLDNVQYVPSAGKAPGDAFLKVYSDDPGITYSSSWGKMDGRAGGVMGTQSKGETMKFSWRGTGLTWLSTIPSDKSRTSTTGSYSIDGGDPVTFTLAGLGETETTKLRQTFFTTPNLSPGDHTIVVTYLGDTDHTPLTLDFLYVAATSSTGPSTGAGSGSNTSAAGAASGSPSPTNSPSNTSNSPANPSSNGPSNGSLAPSSTVSSANSSDTSAGAASASSKPPIGAIFGGVVGGLAVIALFCLVFFMWRRRRRPTGAPSTPSSPVTSQFIPTPYTAQNSTFGGSASSSSNLLPNRGGDQFYPVVVDGARPLGKQSALNQYRPPPLNTPGTSAASASTPAPSEASAVLRPLRKGEDMQPSERRQDEVVVQHHDSGARIAPQVEIPVREVPPVYTFD